jgi:hypothetical protein
MVVSGRVGCYTKGMERLDSREWRYLKHGGGWKLAHSFAPGSRHRFADAHDLGRGVHKEARAGQGAATPRPAQLSHPHAHAHAHAQHSCSSFFPSLPFPVSQAAALHQAHRSLHEPAVSSCDSSPIGAQSKSLVKSRWKGFHRLSIKDCAPKNAWKAWKEP